MQREPFNRLGPLSSIPGLMELYTSPTYISLGLILIVSASDVFLESTTASQTVATRKTVCFLIGEPRPNIRISK